MRVGCGGRGCVDFALADGGGDVDDDGDCSDMGLDTIDEKNAESRRRGIGMNVGRDGVTGAVVVRDGEEGGGGRGIRCL